MAGNHDNRIINTILVTDTYIHLITRTIAKRKA